MGFERLVRAIQAKASNYDTDVFTPLLDKIASLSGLAYGLDEKTDVAFRVIADHIRAISFAITDGQLPGNAKAGYVIRRILRRAVRYGYSFLGQKKPFLYTLVPVLANQFKGVFDELYEQQDFVARCIHEEEAGFLRTLESGIRKVESLNLPPEAVIDGAIAFELYDTYGFPLDLTALLAREAGHTIDEKGFEVEMEKQKDRSRKAGAVSYGDWQEVSGGAVSQFVGYDTLTCQTLIQRVRLVESKGEQYLQAVLADSPFYAESGGQIGDTGTLVRSDNTQWHIPVLDTKKENDLNYVLVAEEYHAWLLQPGEWVATVDASRRQAISSNHSATHLLHAALRQVLGKHVQQKGSLVSDKELRFDFSHPAKVSDEELALIEDIANVKITEGIPLQEDRYVPQNQAIERGAMALFGEKYGDQVRVITFEPGFSVELCGGTHVTNTQQIRICKIIAEGSVAAGVRRITAVSADGAWEYLNAGLYKLEKVKGLFKAVGSDLSEQVLGLIDENAALKKRLKDIEASSLAAIQAELSRNLQIVGNSKLIVAVREVSAESAKTLVFELGKAYPDAVVILGSIEDGKPLLSIYLGTLVQELNKADARALVKVAGPYIQGGGGGQSFYATAGGKHAAGIQEAVSAAAEAVKKALA
jgi:alanyl-tRNA synthetase